MNSSGPRLRGPAQNSLTQIHFAHFKTIYARFTV
jgi:hypothetical protein